MKDKIIIGVVVLAVVMLISGAGIMAFASPATQTDPLITLSYLTDIFTPYIMSEVNKSADELTATLNARIDKLEAELKASQGNQTVTPGEADGFKLVTLNKGQSLTCSIGAELLLRLGSATCFGAAPALIDYTDGATLSSGTAMTVNHMYTVTIEGNGVKATTDNVRILIRGTYKIS